MNAAPQVMIKVDLFVLLLYSTVYSPYSYYLRYGVDIVPYRFCLQGLTSASAPARLLSISAFYLFVEIQSAETSVQLREKIPFGSGGKLAKRVAAKRE